MVLFILGILLLCGLSLCFFIPWICVSRYAKVGIVAVWMVICLGLYAGIGSGTKVKTTYTNQSSSFDLSRSKIQTRITEFRKIEIRSRMRLERVPDDRLAQWQLYDVLANQSLYRGDFEQALKEWKAAWLIIRQENHSEWKADEIRIKTYITAVETLKKR